MERIAALLPARQRGVYATVTSTAAKAADGAQPDPMP